jgi:DNA polymerase-3 subunit gamma/tau
LAPDGPGSVDVIEIDAASHGGVDDARDLREKAFFAPVASRYKVYVIDEAHMVTTSGFNALLKLVEEPPDFVVFVFATTEPEKVLGTIRSRTHHYPFRLAPPSVLRPYLEELCEREDVRVEPAVFPLVVRAGGGSFRDSLSVLDQLIAGAGDQGVTYARAVALLGVTDVALIDEMVDALAAGDGAAAFSTIDRVADAGHDPRRFATDLLERLRDLIVLQRVTDATGSGIIDAPADQLERMAGQAARVGPGTLSRMADIIHNGLTEMRGTTAPRLLLELITARMLLPGADDSVGALLHRLERMERRLGAAEPEAEGPPATARSAEPVRSEPARSAEPVRSEPARSAEPVRPQPHRVEPAPQDVELPAAAPSPPQSTVDHPVVGSIDAATVRRAWDEVLTLVKRRSSRLHAIIREGTVRDVHGDEIVLLFRSSFHADTARDQPGLLVEALHEVFGGTWRLRVELGGDERARATPAPAARTGPDKPEEGGARAAGGGDWPEIARPGGGDQPPPAPPAAAAPVGRGTKAPTKAPAKTAAPKAARQGSRRGRDDAPPPDEPPFDPDYDAPPHPGARPDGRAAYDGFDPGDEPLDDARSGVHVSSTEQAIRAITAEFGVVERIGDTTHRP